MDLHTLASILVGGQIMPTHSWAVNPRPGGSLGLPEIAVATSFERYYGGMSDWGGGLTNLPRWVRICRQVHGGYKER